MTRARKLAPAEAFASEAERRKRLGQYFTGMGLGRLLAALARADKAKTIIDPMSGSGDLLSACLAVGAYPTKLAGIEIDEMALAASQDRLPNAELLLGSAFDPDLLNRLAIIAWDLVIANPPYVRYQSFSDKADATHALPSAMQIRTDLGHALNQCPALDDEDKRLFGHLVSGYSGLSDLAVPSWILCAALVKVGGRIALVVPESWLSRDYATVVHYLLFRWFEIEFVVEDDHACWFDDAQIKTTLIVAKRVRRRAPALATREGAIYCHIGLSAAAATNDSPIGRMGLPGRSAEKSFARQARLWLRNATVHADIHVRARPISVKFARANAVNAASTQKWFSGLGEESTDKSKGIFVPHIIHDWMSKLRVTPALQTFEADGVAVGQGLRTGANDFFYADGERESDSVRLVFGGALAGESAIVPLTIAKPVLRRQSELPSGFAIRPSTLTGWALDLRRHVLPEDMCVGDLVSASYDEMPSALADLVRTASRANFGTDAKPLRVWELTAVAPNIRKASRGFPQRYWYMLPDFAHRHWPNVLLARVNGGTPKAYLNEGRECLVDANFSSLWTQSTSKWTSSALLAFLNSGWAQALIECSGAVMGGGALKVEASHLRRLPVPMVSEIDIQELDTLGEHLRFTQDNVAASEILRQIDSVLGRSLGCSDTESNDLREIACIGRIKRSNHNGRR
jgi:methylase of polypeptide subunit release factors